MKQSEKKQKINKEIELEMIDAAFEFWFNDSNHIRSPFPEYIRDNLRSIATKKILEWNSQISDEARKDINDEILAEKLEEVIFDQAHSMVLTEDEKLTIRYPFMIRVGDKIKVKDLPDDKAESVVEERWHTKRGDEAFMKVKLKNIASGDKWETEFELPE